MVQSCCASNCTIRSSQGSNISFHRFPRDKQIFDKWILAIRRKNWLPSRNMRLCSLHFSEDAFETSGWSSKSKLKADAVPTIFDLPEDSKVTIVEYEEDETIIIKVEPLEVDIPGSSNEPTIIVPKTVVVPKKRKYFVGDFDRVKSLDKSYKLLQRKNRRIKMLKQKNRRLTKRIADLKSLVEYLKTKDVFSDETATSPLDSAKPVFRRMLKNKRRTYPRELKDLAVTLDSYSPTAYNYVRKLLNNSLPHRRTIQKWYQNVGSEPDLSNEDLEVMEIEENEAAALNIDVVS